ncbi:hypothetical protein PY365_05735 [Roseiarcaceae bacterium H3SJ34-1]|uniref:hypothetical protein n=1 Tax=Terripilifer ovatus TaxID=3032367 RepID=UPI003AB922B9|nr:hypothetical protein [Roseiarcaceae bacterium H3SJ34-1]
MNWNTWIRQTHRWLSIAFTAGVITYIIAMQWGQPAAWIGLLALLPLILLLISGLYLFVLPHAVVWQRKRTGMSKSESQEQTS